MLRTLLVLSATLTINLGLAHADGSEDVAKDLARIKGSWRMTTYEREGRAANKDQVEATVVEFTADGLTFKEGVPFLGKQSKFKIDPSAKQKTIDFTPGSGPRKGQTFRGIYVLDGDTLKFCLSAPGMDRPTEYKTGKGQLMAAFKRDNVK
ncbi:MAG: TIGR03067 domain-containing protein [Gemmataceae bacterium]